MRESTMADTITLTGQRTVTLMQGAAKLATLLMRL